MRDVPVYELRCAATGCGNTWRSTDPPLTHKRVWGWSALHDGITCPDHYQQNPTLRIGLTVLPYSDSEFATVRVTVGSRETTVELPVGGPTITIDMPEVKLA